MPREVVCVQVGQCGNQLGCKYWDVLLEEHLASANKASKAKASAGPSTSSLDQSAIADAMSCLFYQDRSAMRSEGSDGAVTAQSLGLKARCVPIDMEEGVLNAMLRGPLGPIFDNHHFVSDVSGAGNNWAVGYMEYGDKYLDHITETVQKMVEKCDSIQTFFVMHSLSGGTGSGLGTRCLAMLADEFPNVFRFSTVVMPGEVDDVVTAPYNTCFSLREIIEHADCTVPLDNDALAAAADRSAGLKRGAFDSAEAQAAQERQAGGRGGHSVAAPTRTKLPFDSMNAIAAQMLSNLTCSMRFPGALNMDINEVSTNLVPYPKLHFLLSAISPLSVPKHVLTGGKLVDSMFASCLERDHQLINCNPRTGTFLGAAFVCRGAHIDISDITRNVPKMKERMKMIYWNADGFKTALCGTPPLGHQQSMLMLSNNCLVGERLNSYKDKFMKLYNVRSHVHHYSEYIEQQYFDDTVDMLSSCIDDYAFLNQLEPPAQRPKSLRDLVVHSL